MLYRYTGYACVLLCIAYTNACFAQVQDTVQLKEVTVSGILVAPANETSLNIHSMRVSQMRQRGSFNVADALAKLPGISQLNTGVAISKPVIRGLYGNRVLAVLSGLKFDNQQWQDEHGLGLSDAGIDRIEVIKGPVALVYGSEAVGGILNIIEEAPALPGQKTGDVNVSLFSNTYGIKVDAGMKGAKEKRNWGLRIGANSNADYSDGDNKRIVNSRFSGYYLKGALGFTKGNWTSSNHFSSSLDNFGFITADNSNSFPNDGRLSRSISGPHHTVLLNVLSSQNTVSLEGSSLNVNAGLQSNLRLEDEGGGKISLNMLLSTLLWRVAWSKPLTTTTDLILSNNFQFENNTNFGARIIIPDADMIETGAAGFIKSKKNTIILEAGLGISIRNIHTKLTPGVNTPDKAIDPFNKTRPSINAAAGFAWNPTKEWTVKTNVSSGFRSGNLAELSSDGLHEGTLRYEIGDPSLKIEQNINSEIVVAYNAACFEFSVAGYLNHFWNYIFLAPTGTQFLGFDVFRYRQFDANLYGTEATMAACLPNERLKWETTFSAVTGKLTNETNLPFIPSPKWTNELRLRCRDNKHISRMYIFIMAEDHFSQTHPAQFETATTGYWLLNAGLYANWHTKNNTLAFSIACNNLLNKNYYDHLSRFKEYGIHNIGRNVAVNLNIPIQFHQTKNN